MTILEELKDLKVAMDGKPSSAKTMLEALNEISEANGGVSNGKTIAEAVKNIAEAHIEVETIAVTTQPTKTTYIAGQTFDPTGMVVTATYNGKTKVVTGYTLSPSGPLATTDTKVTVTYAGVSAEVNITVNAIDLEVVSAQDADGELFGKVASDLQENIVVGEEAITGTLKFVADYSSAFTGDEASGNYLALKCSAISGAVITVEVVGGSSGPVTLDADGLIVDRIASVEQSIEVKATIDGMTETKTFALTDLTLSAE